MHTKSALAILVIAASLVIAMVPMAGPVSADKSSGSNGLEKADKNIHENTPGEFTGKQDLRFHEGTCQGGHSTEALDQAVGGCSGIPGPGGK